MFRLFLSCLFLVNLVACLDPDPCAGVRANEFQVCLARLTGDVDTDTDADSDADTDTDTDSDADADTDTHSVPVTETGETGGTDPPDTSDTDTQPGETGDTGSDDTSPPLDTSDTAQPADTDDTAAPPHDTGFDDSTIDNDGDGLAEIEGDCDDTEPLMRAGFAEVCDGLDNDCDNTIDDGVQQTFYEDSDGDGYGDDLLGLTEVGCAPSLGFSALGGDCNDGDNATYPGAPEPCVAGGQDRNCDGSTPFDDLDGDGWISCAECDDGNILVYPGGYEFCDSLDNDCDGSVDEGALLDWHPDLDRDGFGNPNVSVQACTAPLNFVADGTDCNDSDPLIKPTATEVCDPNDTDEDCDGFADDLDSNVPVKSLWLADADNDGFGNEFVDTRICDNPPLNFILADANGDGDEYNDPRDCNDNRPDVYPGALIGVCDTADTGFGTDFDCDGTFDCP